ncbi:porin [Xylophilus sp. GW821-FHT01B05]
MKKSLIAFGALLALAGTVQAQSSVTLTGLMDAYVGTTRMAGDSGRTNVVGSGGMTTSWWGIKGTEDLGGGLSANFLVTSFLRADTGSPGRFGGDPFFSRDASVGLGGAFGNVQLGRGMAPNFLPTIIVNPFGDSFNFSPLVLHANVTTTGWATSTTPADTGWSNEVVYTTPSFGGLKANLHYQFGEQGSSSGNGSKSNVGINALYFGGPLTLVGFYERDQISNPVNPSVITTGGVPDTKKDWMLGGAYDAGFLKAFLTYGQSKADIADYTGKTTSLGLDVPLGGGSVKAAVARTEVSGTYNGTRTTGTLGYDYFLSKRTDVYAMVMRDNVTALTGGTSAGVGIRHRF